MTLRAYLRGLVAALKGTPPPAAVEFHLAGVDVLVMYWNRNVTFHDEMRHCRRVLQDTFPAHRVIVVPDSIRFAVIHVGNHGGDA